MHDAHTHTHTLFSQSCCSVVRPQRPGVGHCEVKRGPSIHKIPLECDARHHRVPRGDPCAAKFVLDVANIDAARFQSDLAPAREGEAGVHQLEVL